MKVPAPLELPERLLLGPGPSDVAPSVLAALGRPTVGHLDLRLLEAMGELQRMLRALWGSSNEWTFATPGTGTSGMEAALVNLVRPADRVLVGVHGYFGQRIAEIARRCGAEVVAVEGEWGRPTDPERLRAAAGGKPHALLCAVHAETSTGVLQDLRPLRAVADELGALLLVDAVTSLGCVELLVDEWGLDAAWSCSQKGLSCTPGLAPVCFSPRAVERIADRRGPVRSFYLDVALLMGYWGGAHAYHHTASSNLLCALHEAARLALEEGLEARWERHRRLGRALCAGLEALGLELLVPPEHRLPQLAAVRVPDGVDDAGVRQRLVADHGIEIGGGLGPLRGRLWRIGLMGSGATRKNVTVCLDALAATLAAEGFQPRGNGVEAALSTL